MRGWTLPLVLVLVAAGIAAFQHSGAQRPEAPSPSPRERRPEGPIRSARARPAPTQALGQRGRESPPDNLHPELAARVSGVVVDETGGRAASVLVIARSHRLGTLATARTDSQGRFAFDGLPRAAEEVLAYRLGSTSRALPLGNGSASGRDVTLTLTRDPENRYVLARVIDRDTGTDIETASVLLEVLVDDGRWEQIAEARTAANEPATESALFGPPHGVVFGFPGFSTALLKLKYGEHVDTARKRLVAFVPGRAKAMVEVQWRSIATQPIADVVELCPDDGAALAIAVECPGRNDPESVLVYFSDATHEYPPIGPIHMTDRHAEVPSYGVGAFDVRLELSRRVTTSGIDLGGTSASHRLATLASTRTSETFSFPRPTALTVDVIGLRHGQAWELRVPELRIAETRTESSVEILGAREGTTLSLRVSGTDIETAEVSTTVERISRCQVTVRARD